MRKASILLLIFLAFISVFSSIKALLIYEAKYYDDSILSLPLAEKDAINLKKTLSNIPNSEITILPNPTAGLFISKFRRWISTANKSDTLIIYYAGHGISKNGHFYFIPSDADPEDDFTWIPFDRLTNYIPDDINVVWLIDACYSGSIVKGRPLKVLRIQKEVLHAKDNQVIITSSTGSEISRETPDGSGGIFTVALVKALQGSADKDKDGWIESGELYEFISREVAMLSRDQQHPMMRGKEDIKIFANISGALEELAQKLFHYYYEGKLTELEYRNMKALTTGKSCEGYGVKKIKDGINDYISGKISLDVFVEYVVKTYANKINCEVKSSPSHKIEVNQEEREDYKEEGTAFLKIYPRNDLVKGAEVYIDGKYAGKISNNLFSKEVVSGKHKVLITGKKIDDIEFEFNVGEYEEYEKSISANPATRVVKVITEPPGAVVYVDGMKRSFTPLFIKLKVGESHVITLEKDGYEKLEKKLYIPEKGGVIEKRYKLNPLAELVVHSNPEGAKVFLNGKYVGTTPLSYKKGGIIEGTVIVEMGGLKERRYVKVQPSNKRTVWVSLSFYKVKWIFDFEKVSSHERKVLDTYFPTFLTPAIGKDGTLYVGYDDEYLYAINPDGTLKWKFKTEGIIYSSPAIGKDGTVYVCSDSLYAISPNGSLEWKLYIEGGAETVPTIGPDGTIYVGSTYLYAVYPDGSLKWKFGSGFRFFTSPVIGKSGTIYVISTDMISPQGYLYAIYPDGSLKWMIKLNLDSSSIYYYNVSLDENETVYVKSGDGDLYAINPDGSLKWNVGISESPEAVIPIVGTDGTIYVVTYEGVTAINPNGTLKWRYKANIYSSFSLPVIGKDGTIYINSTEHLYALNPNGTLKWKYKTKYLFVTAPIIGKDGTIYFGNYEPGSSSGYLYALSTSSGGLADSQWPAFHHDSRNSGYLGFNK